MDKKTCKSCGRLFQSKSKFNTRCGKYHDRPGGLKTASVPKPRKNVREVGS